ncbi:DUF305 domain-containing protein [Intrasporangium flavum]|uniref:DUF305 domain-containing protein n=1 Tax=Intrasporangium flavum TaxID=1428657 RepID=UPI00096D9207|nr:DUF305 domain-containing protein [Intrasporangium flavum]
MNDRTTSTLPTRRTRHASLALAAVLTLGTAACGSTGSTGTGHSGHDASSPTTRASADTSAGPSQATAAGPHNDADVAFAAGMVPHHAQAVTMSDLALQRSSNADVTALATAIKGAQDPEIRTMSGWLAGWGRPVPASSGGHEGHDMTGTNGAGGSMAGMMTAEQMASLEAASGPAFDRLWLELMVEHHEGAVSMARTELRDGSSPAAKELAQSVIDGQTAEIATMRALLTRLGD